MKSGRHLPLVYYSDAIGCSLCVFDAFDPVVLTYFTLTRPTFISDNISQYLTDIYLYR